MQGASSYSPVQVMLGISLFTLHDISILKVTLFWDVMGCRLVQSKGVSESFLCP
jgi:hypothetical protein